MNSKISIKISPRGIQHRKSTSSLSGTETERCSHQPDIHPSIHPSVCLSACMRRTPVSWELTHMHTHTHTHTHTHAKICRFKAEKKQKSCSFDDTFLWSLKSEEQRKTPAAPLSLVSNFCHVVFTYNTNKYGIIVVIVSSLKQRKKAITQSDSFMTNDEFNISFALYFFKLNHNFLFKILNFWLNKLTPLFVYNSCPCHLGSCAKKWVGTGK